MTPPLDLFPYQAQAADIMSVRERFGLHDEMGIGKTATAIGAVNRIFGQRGVVICPAILRQNWINEFRKFSQYDLTYCKGEDIHDYAAWVRGRYDVLITSYDQARKWRQDFSERGEYLDFLIMDEAHYLKNTQSQRTIQILGHEGNGQNCWLEYAAHAWHLTGTPMYNDPTDIYPFLKMCNALGNMSFNNFSQTFFNSEASTFGSKYTVNPEMVATLAQLIHNNAIRRTHSDVGMELPPIWLREVTVDGDTKEILQLIAQHPGLEQQILSAIEQGGLSFLDAAHIATLRRLVGKAKVIPYSQLLKWELDSGADKRVIFCLHTEPVIYLKNFLEKFGYGVVTAHGMDNENDRQEAVRRFMEDPRCKVFIGNIKVAGAGLTLTSSCDIDMFESDWAPAGNAQALKRVHRYGQTRGVTARFITLAKSIDEVVTKVVASKTASIAAIESSS